jgi:hypothetical protein
MNTTTTRNLSGLALASAAVTVSLAAAPANATPWGPEDMPSTGTPAGGHGVHGHAAAAKLVNSRLADYQREHEPGPAPVPQSTTTTLITTNSGMQWDEVAYGAAAGIALTTAAGVTLILVRRREHVPGHG